MNDRSRLILLGASILFMLFLLPSVLRADSRTEYLIGLLKDSGNFRVRVQSAKTLGDIGSTSKGDEKKKIIEALITACKDKNELVRMTAAASLGSIGDPLAIPALEKLKSDKTKEVKEQAKDSLKKIETIQKSLAKGSADTTSDTGGTPPASDVKPAFYVGLGSWSDKSGFQKYDTKSYVKNKLEGLISGIPGVKLKPENENKKKTDQVVKKEKLEAYTLTGSIGAVQIEGKNSASASVSIVVLDQEGNVKMMLKGKGSASLEGSKKSSKENEKELVLSALNTAVQGAVEPFSSHLQKTMPAPTKGSDKGQKKKKKKKK
jgi:hypothetical protein